MSGALNIPLCGLQVRLSELDPTQDIVAYCRGFCFMLSYNAVAALRVTGFEARRPEYGLPERSATRLPVIASNSRSVRHGAKAKLISIKARDGGRILTIRQGGGDVG